MTAFAYNTFYPVIDSAGPQLQIAESLTDLPPGIQWFIGNVGYALEGSFTGPDSISTPDDYWAFLPEVNSVKVQPFDYRYDALYYAESRGKPDLNVRFVDLVGTTPGFPGAGTVVNFKTSSGGETIYSGTFYIDGSDVFITNVSPPLDYLVWVRLIAPPSTVSFGMTWFYAP